MRRKRGCIIAILLVGVMGEVWLAPGAAFPRAGQDARSAQAPSPRMMPMILDSQGRRGAVAFSHWKHEAQVHPGPGTPHAARPGVACVGCHHKVEQTTDAAQYKKCSACHRAEGDPENPEDKQGIELNAREAFHRACIGCHLAARVVASNERRTNVGFTKCDECHDRDARVDLADASTGAPAVAPEPPSPSTVREAVAPSAGLDKSPGRPDAPLGYAGASGVPRPEPSVPGAIPTPDRWRIGFPAHPRYLRGSRWNPYRQHYLKGDYPIRGQHTFFAIAAESESFFNYRYLPGSADAGNRGSDLFARGEQSFFRENFIFSLDLSHGDTAFKPVDWRVNLTPQFNLSYLHVQRSGIVNVNPAEGIARVDGFAALQAGFVEVRLGDTPKVLPFLRARDNATGESPYFDSVSVRTGIQPFVSDFRGFVFSDTNLGVRMFGNHANNRYQFNLAWFQMLEKDTNSELNRFRSRDQSVVVANLYRQDTWWKGYIAQLSVHFNHDAASRQTDANGFVVRPAAVNGAVPHDVKAAYLGWAGEGHAGRLNLTHAVYQVFGRDSRNPLAGRDVTINAQMAAAEASVNRDWLRFKTSFFFASGDGNPSDGTARGFDAIVDAPEFAGGRFSFWNSQGLRLARTSANLTTPGSLLANLRGNKFAGQSNFVNPGVALLNAGVDGDLTQKIKAILNVNYLRVARTEPLEALLRCVGGVCGPTPRIARPIGLDYGIGVRVRPWLSENFILEAGYAGLLPGAGLREIYGPACGGPGCVPAGHALHSVFVRTRFVY